MTVSSFLAWLLALVIGATLMVISGAQATGEVAIRRFAYDLPSSRFRSGAPPQFAGLAGQVLMDFEGEAQTQVCDQPPDIGRARFVLTARPVFYGLGIAADRLGDLEIPAKQRT